MPLVNRVSLGKTGEDLACRELRRRGYEILTRRYRTRLGELDIVARDGPTIVFIEVKTRTSTRFGSPSEAVTALKQRRIWLMATDYLQRQGWDRRPCRFDVIEVMIEEGSRARVEVIQSAFDAWE